jgi:hypothetical protein
MPRPTRTVSGVARTPGIDTVSPAGRRVTTSAHLMRFTGADDPSG